MPTITLLILLILSAILSIILTGISFFLLRWWVRNSAPPGYYLNEETGEEEYQHGSEAYYLTSFMVYPVIGFSLGVPMIVFCIYALIAA